MTNSNPSLPRRALALLAAALVIALAVGGFLLLHARPVSAQIAQWPPMNLISRNAPAYTNAASTISPPSDADDADYTTQFRSEGASLPVTLVYDLSGVPASERQSVVSAWYSNDSYYDPEALGAVYYNCAESYTIAVNDAPGGTGTPPTSGWQTLQTVTASPYCQAMSPTLPMDGANWIEMSVTAINGSEYNEDFEANWDVYDASQTTDDSFLMLGDSITANTAPTGVSDNIPEQIAAAAPGHYPIELDAGYPFWQTGTFLGTDPATGQQYLSELLTEFPGHVVAVSLGTNDIIGAGESASVFTANLDEIRTEIETAGKVMALATIPWGCDGALATDSPSTAGTLNNAIEAYYAAHPEVEVGPDLWSWFLAHQSDIGSDCIHPDSQGDADWRTQWANALLADFYSGTAPTPTPTASPTSTPTPTPTPTATLTPSPSPTATPTPSPTPTATPTPTPTPTASPSPSPSPTPTGAGPQLVEHRSTSGTAASLTVTLPTATTAGDLLIATAENYSDDKAMMWPSPWTEATAATGGDSSFGSWSAIAYYADVPAGITSLTLKGTSGQEEFVSVEEWSGMATSGVLDTGGTAPDKGQQALTATASTSAATKQADEVIVAGFTYSTEPASAAPTPGAGFLLGDDLLYADGGGFATEYATADAQGKQTASLGLPVVSGWAGSVAVFLP